jgi:hypothetical protein
MRALIPVSRAILTRAPGTAFPVSSVTRPAMLADFWSAIATVPGADTPATIPGIVTGRSSVFDARTA